MVAGIAAQKSNKNQLSKMSTRAVAKRPGRGWLEMFKLSLYVLSKLAAGRADAASKTYPHCSLVCAVPIVGSWIYNEPETLHKIVRNVRPRIAWINHRIIPDESFFLSANYLQRSYIHYPAEGPRPPTGRVVLADQIAEAEEEKKAASAAAEEAEQPLGKRRYWFFGPREKV